MPGPASYELPVGITPKKLSIGERLDRKIELSPGPGEYNVEIVVTAKTPRAPVAKIGTTKRVEIFVGREDEPGPALYSNIENTKKNQGRTFGLKLEEKTPNTPGPASYKTDIKQAMKHGVIAKAKRQENWTPEDKINSPGPSTYNSWVGIVPKKISMGAKLKEFQSTTPGPGAFNLVSPQK